MNIRTDLATELRDAIPKKVEGIQDEQERCQGFQIKRIKVTSKKGEQQLGRKMGNYVTFELPALDAFSVTDDALMQSICKELRAMLPKKGLVLVVGLGNEHVTPDALGPKTANGVLATRHVAEELKRCAGLYYLRETAVMLPGVVGQTGVETLEQISLLVQKIQPAAVIVIDAMAAKSIDRLGTTIQLCDTGIAPGAGVGNNRGEMNQETLGVPVIAVGVPTVVDAATLLYDCARVEDVDHRFRSTVVTPSQIDLLIDRAAAILSQAINVALHEKVDADLLLSLV